jgi:GH15 family glucan-1,4-alpha-glucosidase
MSWVAFDRAIRFATSRGRPAPLERWIGARDAIYEQVMTKGWNKERGAFVQQYGAACRAPEVGTAGPVA